MTASGGRSIEVLIALVAISGFAAVAYAAGDKGSPARHERRAQPAGPPKPRIVMQPKSETASTAVKFAFTDRQRGVRFECRIDRARWRSCSSPVGVKAAPGRHAFSVRAIDRRGARGLAARARWTRLKPKDFSIVPDLSGLSALYPGAQPLALPLTIENPNSERILVTELLVAVTAEPTGCASAENLALHKSNASDSMPLVVPAHGSVRLPADGIVPPTIQLRDLPVNQDACRNARFPLEFSGSAHG